MEKIIRLCSYCRSIEGSERPVGNYIVKLKRLEDQGNTMLACQSCYINRKTELQKTNETESIMKKKLIDRLKNIFFSTSAIMMFSIIELNAQGLPGPPGFPGDPAAAPIDGGLGLLAAAGGAYAYKKLRNKNKEDDSRNS